MNEVNATSDAELFSARPNREHECPRCHGSGLVSAPYYLRAPTLPGSLARLADAPEGAVSALVVGSASIFDATREASEIAKRARRPVVFDFNEHRVVVRPDANPEQVARDWWWDAYGESPEETRARR